MLECLNVRMLELRLETTWTPGKNNFLEVRGRGALRLLRSSRFALTQPDRAPLATFATRKLLTTFVGGPDRYAAGASRDRRISTPAFFLWRYNWNEYTGEFARAPK